jgi:hypothetical protein
MGYDGTSVFQGAKVGGTTYMKKIVVTFMIKVHFFVDLMNLAMLVLLKLSLVIRLEVLLQAMHVFSLSPKKFFEFQKLYDVFIEKKQVT